MHGERRYKRWWRGNGEASEGMEIKDTEGREREGRKGGCGGRLINNEL